MGEREGVLKCVFFALYATNMKLQAWRMQLLFDINKSKEVRNTEGILFSSKAFQHSGQNVLLQVDPLTFGFWEKKMKL